jgi:hypothetical protein
MRLPVLASPRACSATLAFLLAGCQSVHPVDLSSLAEEPPLPYSVLLTGGARVTFESDEERTAPLASTYRTVEEGGEAFPLTAVSDALQSGRVFVHVALDEDEPDTGAPEDAEASLVRLAQAGQHDLILVIEQLQDGAIEERGINGQWPITAITWLLAGLGMLIPDHTYDSQAKLVFSLRDAQTGTSLYDRQPVAAPVDLPLVQRTDFLGLLTSIIVPPFWVGDDPAAVEETVRAVVTNRLIASLARELKTREVRDKIRSLMPAQLELVVLRDGLIVKVATRDALADARLRNEDGPLGGTFAGLLDALFEDDVQDDDGVRRYEARLYEVPEGRRLQLLVRTVTGRVASTTVALP